MPMYYVENDEQRGLGESVRPKRTSDDLLITLENLPKTILTGEINNTVGPR